ncbi:uncharacterized protein Triagg1_8043 [Trichoderma aggressivum f. europaeum]|uniref:STE24 endopeptidase n=1 Tax=Trichoderma aggressivum f. europaeum TaxID=173218 RepID=A0AAE1LXI1_9HYPO|nr:hypothetical protein Triagg1_8043 [Trichoderma aggressivum f. europaeum]
MAGTALDGAMKSKNVLLEAKKKAFGGVVVAAAAWSIFGGDLFPAQEDPKGDPETWTREEMRRWLAAKRYPGGTACQSASEHEASTDMKHNVVPDSVVLI